MKRDGTLPANFRRNELQVDYALDYGLPGSPGYRYLRPFDYFAFQATASSASKIENVMTHGVLVGRGHEAGDSFRGVWGLYGSYDYIAPQMYRISTTALSIGSTAQWWLGKTLSLQGTARRVWAMRRSGRRAQARAIAITTTASPRKRCSPCA
ncbi:MAG: hypothetical protein M0Z73_09940 [Betaproteobacteria bacterium]|nr:hypothetical protein [Betaproteobacteria bacterium]